VNEDDRDPLSDVGVMQFHSIDTDGMEGGNRRSALEEKKQREEREGQRMAQFRHEM